MPEIELIYDDDCPNVPRARKALREACVQSGIEPTWQEWERSAPASPDRVKRYGSPTVLVGGVDVAGARTEGDAQSCRVYRGAGGGLEGAPPAELIAGALRGKPASSRKSGWIAAVGTLFAGAGALLPVLTCPACWPAYAGLLSALGLGFVNYTPYVEPLVLVLVSVTLISLLIGARQQRDMRPFVLGALGATVLLLGRSALSIELLTWVGFGGLITGSIWGGVGMRLKRKTRCAC